MSHYFVRSTWIYLALRTWLFLFLTTTHLWTLGKSLGSYPHPLPMGTGASFYLSPELSALVWASLGLSLVFCLCLGWLLVLCCRWFHALSLVATGAPWMGLSHTDFIFLCVWVFSSAQGLGVHRGLLEPLECISRLCIIRCTDFLLFILFKQRHERIGWYGHVSKGLGSNCLSAGVLSEQSENVGLRPSTTGTLYAFEEVMMTTELEWFALGKNVIISTKEVNLL